MKIGIVSETTADFPAGLAKKKKIILAPIHININGDSRLHGIDVVNQEIVEHLKQRADVSTKPPTPREYSAIFEEAVKKYDQIYSMHVSSDASDCFKNAQLGLRLLKKRQGNGNNSTLDNSNIKVIDTKCLSISQAQLINRVANIIKTEDDTAKIDKYIKWLISESMQFFIVDDIYWLKKAGRVNAVSSFLGKLLDIKPLIKVKEGVFSPVAKPKGRDAALDTMIETIKKETPEYKRGVEVWVAHSAALLDAKYVKTQLAEFFKIEEKKIPIIESGPTITTHVGPSAVCASIMPR